MPVVNITATLTIEPQDITLLQQLAEAHEQKKKHRRKRLDNAFKVARMVKPNSSVIFLVYASGNCVCLGGRNMDEVTKASKWLARGLKSKLIRKPSVKNIVYNHKSIHGPVSLETLYAKLRATQQERHAVSFEPELSPALIYQPASVAGCKALIFRPGSVNITGLKHFDQIAHVLEELEYIMRPES